MLAWIDGFVSALIRWGMLGVVYLVLFIVLLMEIVGNIYIIFEEEFSIGAIDTLEFLGVVAFLLLVFVFGIRG
jgi:hypothetical protein